MKTIKNNFVIAIVLCLTIYILSMCRGYCKVDWSYPATHLIQFNKQIDYQINGAELEVKLDINSSVTDEAYLVLYVEKEYSAVLEGFKDSLKIDGFHVRSYHIPNGCSADEVPTPVDYPVYIKKTSIKKGVNRENFKIVFPKNIASIPAKVLLLSNQKSKIKNQKNVRITY